MSFLHYNYKNRLVISVMSFLFAILLIVCLVTYTALGDIVQTQFGNASRDVAISVSSFLSEDLDGYRNFLNTRDVKSEYYENIQRVLNEIKESADDVRFIFTANRISDDRMEYIFGVDSFEEYNYFLLGKIDDISPDGIEIFQAKRSGVLEYFQEPHGLLVAGWAPILDENGNLLGIAGVGVDRGTIVGSIRYFIVVFAVMAVMLLGIIFIVLKVVVNYIKRTEDTSQVKTQFLANMSHEIRTPMNAIIGMSELLLNEPLNSRQMDFANDINFSSHSLLSIINDILDLSKIESGKLELNPVDYDFDIFIDNITSMFEFVTQKKGLKFNFECDSNIPKALFGDDIRLRQVLTNIIGNAVKFTENGGVTLTAYVSHDNMLMFEIKDTGMGIAQEDMEKLFVPFEQSNTVKNRGIVGTGLGLSISKTFTEMMGGSITVSSVCGEGTVFTVSIPIVEGDKANISHVKVEKRIQPFYAPMANVLVVDDNTFNLKVAQGLLGLLKIEAETAISGKEALDMIMKNDYDIIFMDHMMPEMDGIETTAHIRKLSERHKNLSVSQIREMNKKYKNLPIIALTANAVHGAKEMFLAHGFNGFISKPIDSQFLYEVLEKWLPHEKIEQIADFQENDYKQPTDVKEPSGDSFLDRVGDIDEINSKIGLRHVASDEKMYHTALESLCRSLNSDCDKMSSFLAGSDLEAFSIAVHAMKGALATVGAKKLSEIAFKLEESSKNSELDFCMENFPGFKDEILSLQVKLSDIFTDLEGTIEKTPGDPALLRENLDKALSAANEFNQDSAIEALDSLTPCSFGAETDKMIEEALWAFKEFDFEKATGVLEELRNLP
ncbi:MAG: ATP-binding protein [Oscillospiraceae bacterium]|nr:ATP-binding protein [Oscillospiraceae bacterium]